MHCWLRMELDGAQGDEKKRSPTPEINPSEKPVPQEAPPAETPQPEIEPYQTPPAVNPDMPQPEA